MANKKDNQDQSSVQSAQLREEWLNHANVLTEALPYMRRHAGQFMVIKYGGHAMGDEKAAQSFAKDMVLLKQVGIHPIIVHGGGPQIGAMLERLKIQSEFVQGLRVTDEATVEIVEMVLAGKINKEIVGLLQQAGGRAIGLSGKDGGLLTAKKVDKLRIATDSHIEQLVDLGFVGEPDEINPQILYDIGRTNTIPVIAPLGLGKDGHTYNINADTAAGAIAGALKASRLLMLTDVAGVLDKDKKLIRSLSLKQAEKLKRDGVIVGGMIPKVDTCLQAVAQGTKGAVILDGRFHHSVLLELFTALGSGTLIGDHD